MENGDIGNFDSLLRMLRTLGMLEDDRKAAIEEILRLGTSAGGQRAKAIIAYNKETGEVRSGQINAPDGFDYYLIKFDGLTGKDLLEFATANNIKNAQEIIDQICETASGWPELAKDCGVPQRMINAIVPHLLLGLWHLSANLPKTHRVPEPNSVLHTIFH